MKRSVILFFRKLTKVILHKFEFVVTIIPMVVDYR